MTVGVIRTTWSFTAGGAGVSTFVVDATQTQDLTQAQESVRDFWGTVCNSWMAQASGVVEPESELVLETTGEISGSFVRSGTLTPFQAAGTGAYAAGVGARVRWATSGRRNNRRIVGTTFIVPLGVAGYESNGTLAPTVANGIGNAADTLLDECSAAGTPLVVWSRPSGGGAADGSIHEVVSAVVPDKVSWLRSRKE